jgi:hypothetical protein
MIRPTSMRACALITSLSFAPFAMAQPLAVIPPQWTFIAILGGFGMLMVLGILAIIFFSDGRKNRDKLALVERLVTSGQPVPHELMLHGAPQLTLPEERRRDIRRAIALLCWGIGIGVVFYIVYGGSPRAAAWGLLLIVPGLGNFLKAWLTAREIARGSADAQR